MVPLDAILRYGVCVSIDCLVSLVHQRLGCQLQREDAVPVAAEGHVNGTICAFLEESGVDEVVGWGLRDVETAMVGPRAYG